MKTALLVGGGLIGFSFAQRFVDAGWQVRMTDVRAELADAVAQEFGDKVRFSTNLEDLTDSVDFVQEAGLESLEFKHKIFARLAGLTDAASLASSTSAILPSKSAADNPAAERIVIGHPFTRRHSCRFSKSCRDRRPRRRRSNARWRSTESSASSPAR